MLYKLFVSIRDKLVGEKFAADRIMEAMHLDKITMMTSTEYVRNTINLLVGELPELIQKPEFYKQIYKTIDAEDKKLKIAIDGFVQVISIVGEDRAEKILT